MTPPLLHEAVISNRQLPEGMIGFEPVTRSTRLLLARDLNTEIDQQSERWNQADLYLQQLGFDVGVGQIDIEHIPNDHIHEGPHESFLMAPAEAFPNISIMAYVTTPSPSQAYDTLDSHDLVLFVETMVRAGPVAVGTEVQFETIVHRRIQRTTESVNAVIRRDTTLLGSVSPQQLPARGGIGKQAWIQNVNNETGQRYMWHGSRLEYRLQRFSTIN
jgi:hypothetical protein